MPNVLLALLQASQIGIRTTAKIALLAGGRWRMRHFKRIFIGKNIAIFFNQCSYANKFGTNVGKYMLEEGSGMHF